MSELVSSKLLLLHVRPGSVVAQLAFDFYYAQDVVEQTKLTWGLSRVSLWKINNMSWPTEVSKAMGQVQFQIGGIVKLVIFCYS